MPPSLFEVEQPYITNTQSLQNIRYHLMEYKRISEKRDENKTVREDKLRGARTDSLRLEG